MPLTRGERNNNPGNIRLVKSVAWHGQSEEQDDSAFVQFIDPVYGIRAIARIMRSYEREGMLTLTDAIDRWAPPNENNSRAYIDAVCAQCGVSASDRVDFAAIMPQLVRAIIFHENGRCIYSDELINEGVSMP